jgi:hypothetical protein
MPETVPRWLSAIAVGSFHGDESVARSRRFRKPPPLPFPEVDNPRRINDFADPLSEARE